MKPIWEVIWMFVVVVFIGGIVSGFTIWIFSENLIEINNTSYIFERVNTNTTFQLKLNYSDMLNQKKDFYWVKGQHNQSMKWSIESGNIEYTPATIKINRSYVENMTITDEFITIEMR